MDMRRCGSFWIYSPERCHDLQTWLLIGGTLAHQTALLTEARGKGRIIETQLRSHSEHAFFIIFFFHQCGFPEMHTFSSIPYVFSSTSSIIPEQEWASPLSVQPSDYIYCTYFFYTTCLFRLMRVWSMMRGRGCLQKVPHYNHAKLTKEIPPKSANFTEWKYPQPGIRRMHNINIR